MKTLVFCTLAMAVLAQPVLARTTVTTGNSGALRVHLPEALNLAVGSGFPPPIGSVSGTVLADGSGFPPPIKPPTGKSLSDGSGFPPPIGRGTGAF